MTNTATLDMEYTYAVVGVLDEFLVDEVEVSWEIPGWLVAAWSDQFFPVIIGVATAFGWC